MRMTATVCPRVFEAEALRDGRLGTAERASFLRHASACQHCAREARAMEALGQALRGDGVGGIAGAEADELHVLRQRTRLLAAFDGTRASSPPRWRRRLWWWPATATALALVIAVMVGRGRGPAPERGAVARRAVVHAAGDAVWSSRNDGTNETVTLDRGTLWIHVQHHTEGGRLVVVLPDGELEDQGTTFTVSAAEGRTQRITVDEGRVLLRLHGQTPVALGPQESWNRLRAVEGGSSGEAAPTGDAPARGTDSHPGVPAAASPAGMATPGGARPAKPRRPSLEGARGAVAPTVTPPVAADPAVEFRAAVAVFQSGDNVTAAAAFAGFVARHARDPRAEDAAYLRVIALQKCGAERDMRRAAAEYLRLFPAGFRRAEVETLTERLP